MLKKKKSGFGLEARTFISGSGEAYLVFRSLDGSYHTFVEVEAKQAAKGIAAPPKDQTPEGCGKDFGLRAQSRSRLVKKLPRHERAALQVEREP
jgi:hypothetical protein